MYSPTASEFQQDQYTSMGGTPHTTVGAVPVRNSRVFHGSGGSAGMNGANNGAGNGGYGLHHHRQGSFGMAMSPPSGAAAVAAAAAAAGLATSSGRASSSMPYDNGSQSWLGTSLDSTGSSFGQSPVFGGGRDLIVSPTTSTGHLDASFANPDDDMEAQQRK